MHITTGIGPEKRLVIGGDRRQLSGNIYDKWTAFFCILESYSELDYTRVDWITAENGYLGRDGNRDVEFDRIRGGAGWKREN